MTGEQRMRIEGMVTGGKIPKGTCWSITPEGISIQVEGKEVAFIDRGALFSATKSLGWFYVDESDNHIWRTSL